MIIKPSNADHNADHNPDTGGASRGRNPIHAVAAAVANNSTATAIHLATLKGYQPPGSTAITDAIATSPSPLAAVNPALRTCVHA